MISDRFNWKGQLEMVNQKFFDLKITNINGQPAIKGILDIPDDNGSKVNGFLIEVLHHDKYPYRFPRLFEVGGDIPNHEDWHKYRDGQCCITILPDEIIKCKNGIDVTFFIDQYAIPFFANHIHRKITGYYKNGEYGHGSKGLIEFYSSLFKTRNYSDWYKWTNEAFEDYNSKYQRNSQCFCGSKVKFKYCHGRVFLDARSIGKEHIINDLNRITQ